MAKKTLKRYIVEKIGKLNECGGGEAYYCSGTSSRSSSASGSCGFGSSTPSSSSRRSGGRGGSEIKELTSEIYGNSKTMAANIEKITKLSKQQSKIMPSQLKNVLQKLKAASEEYVRLIDFYTETL